MSFETVDTTTEVYTFVEDSDDDDALGPAQATREAKSEFVDEYGFPRDEVIGRQIHEAEYEWLGDGEFEYKDGPVIVVLHDPRA